MVIFLALLHFRVQAADKVLGHHLETAPTNVLYVSKTSTIESRTLPFYYILLVKLYRTKLISVCGNHIQEKILRLVVLASIL